MTPTAICSNGAAVLTGQSLPAPSTAPPASIEANGYCVPLRSAPSTGIARSVIWSSRQAHSICTFATAPS